MNLSPSINELTKAANLLAKDCSFFVKSAEHSAPPQAEEKFTKVIVAVHGIGDQLRNATVQSVAGCLASKQDQVVQLPLGFFHGTDRNVAKVRKLEWPAWESSPVEGFGFSEIYWADLPASVVADKHTLEETKRWAQTVVGRLRGTHGSGSGLSNEDFAQAGNVFADMIETIQVMDNILFLARKAGIFNFELKKVLEDYLGDVQLVAEFADHRNEILARFEEQMEHIHFQAAGAPIHIIAHSEGTVVAFLGLLRGLKKGAPWVKDVRGFVTLGSPIDKHLAIWPEIFAPYHEIGKGKAEPYINWCNYYDFGDPVGFKLDTAIHEIERRGWGNYFNFSERQDFGFNRYVLPGAAHNEYWTDAELFADIRKHVIEGVERIPLEDAQAKALVKPDMPSRPWVALQSAAIPYLISATLVFAGVLVLYAPVSELLNADESFLQIAHNTLSLTFLLIGMTIAVRVPRLTKESWLRIGAWVVFASSVAVYHWGMTGEAKTNLGKVFPGAKAATYGVPALAFVSVLLATMFKRHGRRALIGCGAAMVAILLSGMLNGAQGIRALWPILLSGGGFLYLWWLGTLIFDLSFTWHRYIKHSKIQSRITGWHRAKAPSV